MMSENIEGPKGDEISLATENFNDGDNTQTLNTGGDSFDEEIKTTEEATPIKNEVLTPGSTDMLDEGEKPILNQDDKSI